MGVKQTLYQLLQVDPQAETGLIEQAYLYLAAKYHPDNKASGDPAKFRQVTDAWKLLSDESSRKDYDWSLVQGCSFCAKSQDDVAILIAGPGVYICNECIDLINEILAEGDSYSGNPGARCSFCASVQEQSHIGLVVAGPGVYICEECVDLCNEIIAEQKRKKEMKANQKKRKKADTPIHQIRDSSKSQE